MFIHNWDYVHGSLNIFKKNNPSQNIIIPLGIVPCISVACKVIENALQVTSLVIQFDHTGFRFMTSYQMLLLRRNCCLEEH